MTSVPDLPDLVARVRSLCASGRRVLIGLVGEPGAGKSTVSAALERELNAHGIPTVVVPMDGFHLANVELARLGMSERKGAAETFDASGYAALLARLRAAGASGDGFAVYAPTYDRSIEESVAGAIAVPAGTQVVLTEGNYLLLEADPWCEIPSLLDEVWAVRVDPAVRRARLVARHERFGKSPERARQWVDSVDEPNAVRIAATLDRADLQIWERPSP